MTPVHLTLLGSFRARLGDGRVIPVRRRKARALLAYLAMRPGEPQPREKLIALLWGDADPGHARHSLRQTLTVLRRDLALLHWREPFLAGEAVCLGPHLIRVDVATFERLSTSAETRSLEQAAAMYRGDFLEGLGMVGEAFETWLAAERDRLRARAVRVLDRLLAVRMATGATASAVDVTLRLLGIDPLREDVHRVLMRLHLHEGRRAAAIRQYRACVAILRNELDVSPEDETTQLYRAILARSGGRGEAGREAIRLHCQAAAGAILRSAFPEAVACLDQALDAIGHPPSGRRWLASAIDVRLGFERALMPLGEIDRLREHLGQARVGALALRDRRRLEWVMVQRMSCDLWGGDAEAAAAAGKRAMETAAATGDARLRLGAGCRLAQAHYYLGDFRRGAELAGDLAAARSPGDLSLTSGPQGVLPAVHCRVYLALCLTELGHFASARAAALEAVRLAERAAHEWSLAFARGGLGTCDLQRGRPREASDSFAIAQGLERGEDGAARFVLSGAPIGSAYALGGRHAEGVALIEAQARTLVLGGLGTFRQRSVASLARLRLRQGRIEEARALAEEALRVARAQRERAGEASALHLLAAALGRVNAGEATSRARALSVCLDALARAEALGMRPLVARCQETLEELWERAGNTDRAQMARVAAADLRRELGLPARAASSPRFQPTTISEASRKRAGAADDA
jgi:DNA-binding SARP family transcriptional activator